MNILEVLKNSEEFLKKKGIDSPRLIAELITSNELNLSRIELYTNYEKPLTEKEINTLREKITRASQHEPIQYITGETEFIDIKIKCDKRALIPRPETEEMVAFASSEIKGDEKILDIGTGSGCIAVYLANKFPNAEINAIDISNDSIQLAKENAEFHKLSNVHFYQADIFKQIPKKKYDIIISNPPYISTKEINGLDENVRLYEPYTALDGGKKGVTFYEFIASILMKILSQNGKFYFEFGFEQGNEIREIFNDFNHKIIKDINGIERFISGDFE